MATAWNEQQWWAAEDRQAIGDSMRALMESIRTHYTQRQDSLLRNAASYSGAWDPQDVPEYSRTGGPDGPLVISNVVASNVDTLTSKVAKNKPRARFLTAEGDFSAQQRAKTLQRFVDGQFEALKAYSSGISQFRDAAIYGTGLSYWYRRGAAIYVERVLPGELLVDPMDGLYADPRCLYRVRLVDRGVLTSLYPSYRAEIAEAPPADLQRAQWAAPIDANNRVEVIEGWHLPSSSDASDGKRCVVLGNEVLDMQPWTRDTFPFVTIRWRSAPVGYWGIGVADDLDGIQQELVTAVRKIRSCLHMAGKPWVISPPGREVDPKTLTNELGTVLPAGTVIQVFSSVPPELFRWVQWLIDESYRVTGVSQLSAASQKPAGVNSGVALQEVVDIETERFQEASRNVEQMYMDYARQLLELAREISEDPKARAEQGALLKGRRGIERVDWSEVVADREAFILQMFSASSLSQHPAAKMDQVMTLLQSQLIDPAEALRLLEFPDLEAFTSLRDAGLVDIDDTLEGLERGRALTPEPFQDLARLRAKVQEAYLRARSGGAPDDTLDGYRDYIAQIGALEQRMAQDAARQQAAQAPQMAPAPAGGPLPDQPPLTEAPVVA